MEKRFHANVNEYVPAEFCREDYVTGFVLAESVGHFMEQGADEIADQMIKTIMKNDRERFIRVLDQLLSAAASTHQVRLEVKKL